MKRILSLIAFVIVSAPVFSQSLSDVEDYYKKKDFAGAKVAIDKYLADPKNADKSESWYYKGRVYNALSYEASTLPADKFTLKNAAYEAFLRNQQLDPKDQRMILELHKPYLDLYFSFYDLGATFFNNKDFKNALLSFEMAQTVENYMRSKNYTYTEAKLYALDTALVMNAAFSAAQAKDEITAVKYYKKLADANVSGDSYLEVYEYLANYYLENNKAAELNDILNTGRRIYPSVTYWNDMEIKMVGKAGDRAAMLLKYEEMFNKYPNDFFVGYNYSVELFNDMYGKNAKTPTAASRSKLTEVLKKIIPLDKENDALNLLANHLFNISADYATEASMIKGTKPDDIKKKKDLNAASLKVMDEYLVYAIQAEKWYAEQATLKAIQSANFRSLLGNISDIYAAKGDAKKAADYRKKSTLVK